MRVLGLDIATVTGWVILDLDAFGGFEARWGTLDFSPEHDEEAEGARLLRMQRRLPPLLEGVDAVGMEQPYSNSYRTAQILYGLTAVAMVEMEKREIEYAFIHLMTLKKWATGSGKASKGDMIAEAEKYLGSDARLTSDEADAFHVARWITSMKVPTK